MVTRDPPAIRSTLTSITPAVASIEQRPKAAGQHNPLARLHIGDPQMLDPAAAIERLAEAPAGP